MSIVQWSLSPFFYLLFLLKNLRTFQQPYIKEREREREREREARSDHRKDKPMEIGIHHIRYCPTVVRPPPHHQIELDRWKDKPVEIGVHHVRYCPIAVRPPTYHQTGSDQIVLHIYLFIFHIYLFWFNFIVRIGFVLCFLFGLCETFLRVKQRDWNTEAKRHFLIPSVVFLFPLFFCVFFFIFFFYFFYFRFRFKGNREKLSDYGSQNRVVEPPFEQFLAFWA